MTMTFSVAALLFNQMEDAMFTVQMWACEKCGRERVYGNCPVPDADRRQAYLLCEGHCAPGHLLHEYVRTATRRWDGEEVRVN